MSEVAARALVVAAAVKVTMPSFWTMRAYLRDTKHELSSLSAPGMTIFPDAKMRVVILGSRIR